MGRGKTRRRAGVQGNRTGEGGVGGDGGGGSGGADGENLRYWCVFLSILVRQFINH